jgi:branched-chain amino acid aminotransferase
MNFFVFWKNEQGEDELITAPLDGTILPGITRDSIIKLMQELGQFKVT